MMPPTATMAWFIAKILWGELSGTVTPVGTAKLLAAPEL
jgi:hypothetical protein